MTDRSHLTPDTIVDRRGRTTTVYRNPGTGSAAPSGPVNAIPAVPVPVHAPAARALRVPAPLGEKEIKAAASQARILTPGVPWLRDTLTGEAEGRTALALAREVSATGALTEQETLAVLGYGVGEGGYGRGAALALDYIRVAERIAQRCTVRGRYWASDFSEAMLGARRGHPGPMSTVADLDSIAAVTAFVLWDAEAAHTASLGSAFYYERRLAHAGLAGLLRERPADLDRIIEYVEERGMGRESSADVDALREWLETTGGTSAVGDGWL